MKKIWKRMMTALVVILVLYFLLYWLQNTWAHGENQFLKRYQNVELDETSDYKTIFLQTGLGETAAKKLIEKGEFQTILDAQKRFGKKSEVICKSVFGMFSRVDKLKTSTGTPLVDLQPGDILITLSTHSIGWHHGHAGLVLDEKHVLECVKVGEESEIVKVGHWRNYSNYAVLRVKGISKQQQQKVVSYAKKNLYGIPYRLTVGMIGAKQLDVNSPFFGTHCAHSVWYAWKQFGYDLDSDGGKIVTPYDLLHSDKLEVVQIYGMDPRNFL